MWHERNNTHQSPEDYTNKVGIIVLLT